MPGGTSTHNWRSGIPSIDSLTLQSDNSFTITRSHNSSDGESDSAARAGGHLGPSTLTGAQYGSRPSQRTSHNADVLANPDHFEDAPYVPPRPAQPLAQLYQSPEPHIPQYDPHPHERFQDVHNQYPYEGGKTSPSDSQHSIESNWSTSSSSSTSSRQNIPGHEYYGSQSQPSSQYSQSAPFHPTLSRQQSYQAHYPAYHGPHRVGLEHLRYGEQPAQTTAAPYYRPPGQGYPIDSILTSDVFDDTHGQVPISSQIGHSSASHHSSSSSSSISITNRSVNTPTFSVSPTALSDAGRSVFPDAGPYLRQQLGLGPLEPVNLDSLPDPPPGEKPTQPYPMLIKLAIYGSPNKQLTLQEIYTELERRFQWFRDRKHEKAWKNSIRHNLSLNKVFRHVPRPITEPGKGSYWQLDVSEGEGYKRLRKRRTKTSKAVTSDDEEEEISEMDDESVLVDLSQSAGSSRGLSAVVDDSNIDPDLRQEGGHVVGEGRTRSGSRRAGVGSPYPAIGPSQSPRYQQGQLPPISDTGMSNVTGQQARFGQPSFGQASFVQPFGQSPMRGPVTSAPSNPAFMPSTSAPQGSTVGPITRPTRSATTYDRNTPIIPQPGRPGVEYVRDQGSLPTARRVQGYPTSYSQDSMSSGSSQPWANTRFTDPKGKGRTM